MVLGRHLDPRGLSSGPNHHFLYAVLQIVFRIKLFWVLDAILRRNDGSRITMANLGKCDSLFR